MQRFPTVARYYDANTRWFLRLGGAAASATIHRQLWGPGVASADAAARYTHWLLADAIDGEGPAAPAVLDLGCGVGGTLLDLADRLPALTGVGVTLSETQVRHARRAAERLGWRCRFERGDFETLRLADRFDVAFAIEAYVHTASPERFFAAAAAHLASGGLLIVVDDFLVADAARFAGSAGSARSTEPERSPVSAAAAAFTAAGRTAGTARKSAATDSAVDRLAADFRRGWHAPGFTTVAASVAAARAAGFELEEDRDLSALIRLDRSRDRLVALVAPVLDGLGLGRWPYVANLIGGAALTAGLRCGAFSYRWLAFRRAGKAG